MSTDVKVGIFKTTEQQDSLHRGGESESENENSSAFAAMLFSRGSFPEKMKGLKNVKWTR